MKTLLKGLITVIFLLVIIGVCFAFYILNAPPVQMEGEAKLQVHKSASLRGRPTVNSKPIARTKDVYLFSLDRMYISNLNSGILSRELLFSIALGKRSLLSTKLLDKEINTAFDWQKTFANSVPDIKFNSRSFTLKVVLSGRDWILSDNTGASYTIEKVDDQLDIYLPDLREVFSNNRITLSANVNFSVEKIGKQWLINDKNTTQVYEIRNDAKKLDIFQQSKYPIQKYLFKVDMASLDALVNGKFSSELRQGFVNKKIPLSGAAKLFAEEIGMRWKVIDGNQKYKIHNEDGLLKVYLDFESAWLLVRVNDNIKGWVQRINGTIYMPPKPILSSRQQLRDKLVVFIEKLKE